MCLHAEDGNLLAGPGAEAFKRAVDCEAGAHHWGGLVGGDLIRDGEGEVFMSANMAGVSTLGYGSIRVRSTISI